MLLEVYVYHYAFIYHYTQRHYKWSNPCINNLFPCFDWTMPMERSSHSMCFVRWWAPYSRPQLYLRLFSQYVFTTSTWYFSLWAEMFLRMIVKNQKIANFARIWPNFGQIWHPCSLSSPQLYLRLFWQYVFTTSTWYFSYRGRGQQTTHLLTMQVFVRQSGRRYTVFFCFFLCVCFFLDFPGQTARKIPKTSSSGPFHYKPRVFKFYLLQVLCSYDDKWSVYGQT